MEPLDLDSIPARDVMQSDVYRLDPQMPIREALEVFEDLHISGAPVVDDGDRVIGVLSSFDVIRPTHLRGDGLEAGDHEFSMLEPEDTMRQQLANDDVILDRETYSSRLWGGETVADWMSPRVISVPPDASVARACRVMVREDIHRVFVMEEGRLLGVLSSFDVVRLCAWDRQGLERRARGDEGRSQRGRAPLPAGSHADLGGFERTSVEPDASASGRGRTGGSSGRGQDARYAGPRHRGGDRGRAGRGGGRDVPADRGVLENSLRKWRREP